MSKTPLVVYHVDAFTPKAFKGNPACVVILENGDVDRAFKQSFAAEMNLSETAYLLPNSDGSYDLSWFTPLTEVSLCGHATLASIHVLSTLGRVKVNTPITFHTLSGVIKGNVQENGTIDMDFPAKPPAPFNGDVSDIMKALGISEYIFVGRNGMDTFIEIPATEGAIQSLKPNFQELGRLDTRGVIVTSVNPTPDGQHDFISRFFGPAVGIDEDPVTGSAHCALGPYFAEKLGKSEVTGYQASARGGTVKVKVCDNDRVLLQGVAVVICKGEIFI